MSKRIILSIILIGIAAGAILLDQGMAGGLIGAFLFVVMLLLWAIPSYPTTKGQPKQGPGWKRLTLAFLATGLGILASVTAALILPRQVFPWVIMAVGTGMIIWIIIPKR